MREPATVLATGDSMMDSKSVEGSSAHCTTAEGEIQLDSGDLIEFDMDIYADMPILLPPSSEISACPELSVCPVETTEVVPLSTVLPVLGVGFWCVWAAHTVPEIPGTHKFPPTLLLLPPPVVRASALPLLCPIIPSAPPQPTICVVG